MFKAKLSGAMLLIVFIASTIPVLVYASPTPNNLIPNNSVELGATNPDNWSTESWGTNTPTYEYRNSEAQDGNKSLYLKITNFSSGDAKWQQNPITVSSSTKYTYSDYYKSTVLSLVVLREIDANNAHSYSELGQPATATNWTKFNANFTTKATTKKIQVLHLLPSNGELSTDNFSLTTIASPTPTPTVTPTATPVPTTTIPPTTTVIPTTTTIVPTTTVIPTTTIVPTTTPPVQNTDIPNNSLETSSGNLPKDWTKSKWGTNTAAFTYQTTGHTGNKSVKVNVSNYKSGDAKWSYTPQVLAAGTYKYTDWYQSNASTEVALNLVYADGTEDFLPLPNAPVSTSWKQYSGVFDVPANASKVAVVHFVATNGYLVLDDLNIALYTHQSFNRPLLSMTFDDGWEENSTTALPLLEQNNFKSTQCFATTFIEGKGHDSAITDFSTKGHEICSHSVTHPDMAKVNTTKLDYELKHSQEYLNSVSGGGSVTTFAAPFGSYSDQVFTYAQKYYESFRSTDAGYNTKDSTNIYNIKVQNVLNTTTAQEVQGWVDHAKATNSWLVLVYHVVTDAPDLYDTTPELFESQLDVIKNSGITVKTWKAALSEVKSQL